MRAKPLALGTIAVAGAVALGAGSQPWISFALEGGADELLTGHDLNAALSPIAIAIIVSALALAIAGPIFRRVLGVLVAGLGVGIAALAVTVTVDPAVAITARVTELTGLAGHAGSASVASYSLLFWSWVTVVAGGIAVLAGVAVVLTSGRWGFAGRKYEASPAKNSAHTHDRISDWDSLSEGEDPTVEVDTEDDGDAGQGKASA